MNPFPMCLPLADWEDWLQSELKVTNFLIKVQHSTVKTFPRACQISSSSTDLSINGRLGANHIISDLV